MKILPDDPNPAPDATATPECVEAPPAPVFAQPAEKAVPSPKELFRPYFTQGGRQNRRTDGMPFAEYQAIPAVNQSLLRQPTAYEMLCYQAALTQIDAEAQWLVESRGASVVEAMGMVEEMKPRTVPRMFVAFAMRPPKGIKITPAQSKILDQLEGTKWVDAGEFHSGSLNTCLSNGWVQQQHFEAPVASVSDSVRAGRAEALCIGDASHKAILEPHMFDADEWHQHWQLCPTESLVSQKALAAQAEDPTRRLITPAIIDTARRVRDAVWRHKKAAELLRLPGKPEVVVEVWDVEMEVHRKIRVDWLPDAIDQPTVDIKTTRKNLQSFKGAVYENGYHVQDAFYTDTLAMFEGQPRPGFMIIAVTKEPPFIARVFELNQALPDESFYVKGREIYMERLATLCMGYHNDQWDAYENEDAQLLIA